MTLGPVRWLLPILADYDLAGGGLLAAGLAFNSLFAILPAILLVVAVVGVILGDPGRLAVLSASLSASVPPLAGVFEVALGSFAHGAVTYSLVGLIALVWGASRFFQSLDDALARILESTRRRDPFRRGLLGVGSVLLLAGVIGGLVLLSGLAATAGITDAPGASLATTLLNSPVAGDVASALLFVGGIALVYRFVPTNRPTWTMIGRPATATGLFCAAFTSVFALLTPQLVGSLEVYGAFVGVLAAMVWLSFVCQAVLIGAAWVHQRGVTLAAAAADAVPNQTGSNA
ncbi:MAG TPA: YhjD/YihY/BrkB family envelope integrity protein [Candidatus Limnocylindrales bacterium]|nr:YhjD/YihY/BrkB family envelope integrity protein [Candidatus Limnocylindrales bacterium]